MCLCGRAVVIGLELVVHEDIPMVRFSRMEERRGVRNGSCTLKNRERYGCMRTT